MQKLVMSIKTDQAPKAIGPYEQAKVFENLVFVSGQLPIDHKTGEVVLNDIKAATRLVLTNIANILTASGSSLDNVLKTNVYMTNLDEFAQMNEVYAEFFTNNKPARATVGVNRLVKDATIEIDVIAIRN